MSIVSKCRWRGVSWKKKSDLYPEIQLAMDTRSRWRCTREFSTSSASPSPRSLEDGTRAPSLIVYLDGQARLDLVVERIPIIRRDVQEDTLVARTNEAVLARHSDVIRAASPRGSTDRDETRSQGGREIFHRALWRPLFSVSRVGKRHGTRVSLHVENWR